jgi:biopolymer transport protein ExbB
LDWLLTPIELVRALLAQGGLILWVILIVTLFMWTLILERYAYFIMIYPAKHKQVIDQWQQRKDRSSWHARRIRDYIVAETSMLLRRFLLPIRTMTVILPLLGLLGTVEGMIKAFNVLSVFGTGNARALAQGVSLALVTTMAGLMASLSGLYFSANLDHRADNETHRLAHKLRLQ